VFCKRTRAGTQEHKEFEEYQDFRRARWTLPPLFIIFLIAVIAPGGCARPQGTIVERLGVMPIENLSSDAQLGWLSRAAAAAVVYDLAGAKKIFARQVDSLSAAQTMHASRLLEGYFLERNGRMVIRATVEDLAKTKAIESFEIEGVAGAGFLPLANELARKLSSDARMFGTSNESAFRFYGEAVGAKESKGAEQALQQATDTDPGFAAGYVEEAELLAETGDRERARRVAEAGARARLDSIDRANLQYVAGTASEDATDRIRALESLTAATPANADTFRELGEMRYMRREFQEAAMEYRVAAGLNPESPQIWNELGYALAWTKDLRGAREALAQYQKLAPEDANALDSQGEVSYMLGDFKSAGGYFERAAERNPAELLKAAEARLMMGDLKGADELFGTHLGPGGVRSGVRELQMAEWEFLTGRRKAGADRIEKFAREASGDLQAVALSQLSVWKLDAGDRTAAAELANRAAMLAQGPQAREYSAKCQYLASGRTEGSGSKMADALARVFANQPREAIPLLEAVYSETSPSADWQVRTLLAWAYLKTGAADKAAKLVEIYPLPLSSADAAFASVVFPRYLSVRAAVQKRQGSGITGG
jgi:tetratricopeptide (TPR) repeat protein